MDMAVQVNKNMPMAKMKGRFFLAAVKDSFKVGGSIVKYSCFSFVPRKVRRMGTAVITPKMAPIIKTKKLHDDLFGEVLYSYLSPKAWLEE